MKSRDKAIIGVAAAAAAIGGLYLYSKSQGGVGCSGAGGGGGYCTGGQGPTQPGQGNGATGPAPGPGAYTGGGVGANATVGQQSGSYGTSPSFPSVPNGTIIPAGVVGLTPNGVLVKTYQPTPLSTITTASNAVISGARFLQAQGNRAPIIQTTPLTFGVAPGFAAPIGYQATAPGHAAPAKTVIPAGARRVLPP